MKKTCVTHGKLKKEDIIVKLDCRLCRQKAVKKWRKENHQHTLEYNRKYYAKLVKNKKPKKKKYLYLDYMEKK